MKRIDIKNRKNLTLLAKAYYDNLLPRGKGGDIFYTKASNGEIDYIYFENDYYSKLSFETLNIDILQKVEQSNSSADWKELFAAIRENEEVSDYDYAKLHLYDIVNINFDTINIPEERVSSVLASPVGHLENRGDLLSSLENDLKRIYIGMTVDVFFQDGMRLDIDIPIDTEHEQRFPFKPIILLFKKYNLEMEDMRLYKGESNKKMRTIIMFKKSDT